MIVDYSVTLVPQTTPQNCWVAATSMLLSRTIPSDGSWVGPGGGLNAGDVSTMRQFADHYGLTAHMQMSSLTTSVIEGFLRRGPFMLISGVGVRNGVIGTHALVIGGINGGAFHGYDPEPVNRGTDTWVNMAQFNSVFPFNAFWVFQRR